MGYCLTNFVIIIYNINIDIRTGGYLPGTVWHSGGGREVHMHLFIATAIKTLCFLHYRNERYGNVYYDSVF